MIKGRHRSLITEIALCSSKASEMYCCRTCDDNEMERFWGIFLISKMLFIRNCFIKSISCVIQSL